MNRRGFLKGLATAVLCAVARVYALAPALPVIPKPPATIRAVGMTATEMNMRQDEKLLKLQPILDRLNRELVQPMLDHMETMRKRGPQ